MDETNNIQSKPEDFIQNGMEFTYVWNPRIVTDKGQGSWTIQPKEELVFTPDRPPPRLFDDLSTSTNSGTAPAALTTTTELAPLLSASIDNSEMMNRLNQRALTIDPRYDAPAPDALAAPTSVMGMFPEVEAMQRALYQQKQNEAMQAQAMQFARLSPMEQAQYSLYMGGQQLGGAIGGALGAKDPQMQLISMRNAISRQIDMRSPESYYKAATLANQAGDREFATSLVDVGRKLELDTSLIQQRTREKQAADPFQQLLRTGKYTPASMAAYEISKNVADLREVDSPNKIPAKIQEAQTVAKNKGFTEGTPEFNAEVVKYLEKTEKEPSVGSDREAIAKDMFFKPFSQLTQEQIKAVNAKKKADDLEAAEAGTSQQQKQDKVILANKAKLAETVETEAYGAEDRLTLARNLKTLLPQAFTGVGSDVVLEASRLAEVFGINIQGVPSSQIIDTILGELTIGAASNLKGSLSDKDVRFLKETIGTRGLSIRTLQYVADRIEENALIDNGVNNSLATYLKDGNDLNEYNFPAERKKVTEQIRKDKKRLQELREKQQKSK